jgi:hypothetical protein
VKFEEFEEPRNGRKFYWKDDVDAFLATLDCPDANGFEGPRTFPPCGECPICAARISTGRGLYG